MNTEESVLHRAKSYMYLLTKFSTAIYHCAVALMFGYDKQSKNLKRYLLLVEFREGSSNFALFADL